MYFQRVEIRALSVTVDTLPRRLDVVAMRAGSKAEVCMRQHCCTAQHTLRGLLAAYSWRAHPS